MKQIKLYSILLCYPIEYKFNEIINNAKIVKNCRKHYYRNNDTDLFLLNKKNKTLYVRYFIWCKFLYNDKFDYIIIGNLIKHLFKQRFNLEIKTAYTFSYNN